MEIIIQQTTLVKVLELIARISTKHVTLPVLQCVLITVEKKKITFTATNLEIAVKVEGDGEVIEEGIVAVPTATLLQTIQYLPSQKLNLKFDGSALQMEGKQTQTSINTIPYDEFPSVPSVEGVTSIINRQLFSLGIKTVAFAASQSSIKPELGSIDILQKKEHSLTFVATDSFRLMEKTVPQKGVVFDSAILIPQKNAVEIARICDLLESDPEFVVGENQCSLTFKEGVYVTTRLVNGSFPDYEQIMPKEFSASATVLKKDLLQAFKKTSVFLNRFMQATITLSDGACTISSSNNEVGHVTDTINAKTTGEELTLNFNQRYLIEPLSHITDDSVILKFAGIGRPLVIEGINDRSIRYLVMPMNK